jgi:hypothetical protein
VPAREMLRSLVCLLSGLGMCLTGALLSSSGQPAHGVAGALLFALGAAGVGLQGWHAVRQPVAAPSPGGGKGAVCLRGRSRPVFRDRRAGRPWAAALQRRGLNNSG